MPATLTPLTLTCPIRGVLKPKKKRSTDLRYPADGVRILRLVPERTTWPPSTKRVPAECLLVIVRVLLAADYVLNEQGEFSAWRAADLPVA